MSEKKLLTRVRTFATSANLGPGYDCAGLALNIYNEHEVYLSDLNSNCVSIKGSNDYGIEKDEDVYKRQYVVNSLKNGKYVVSRCV